MPCEADRRRNVGGASRDRAQLEPHAPCAPRRPDGVRLVRGGGPGTRARTFSATSTFCTRESSRSVRLPANELEPAWVRWGLGSADVAVNRRERDDDGIVRDIGWNDRGIVDTSVPVLQAVRRDGSAIATVVSFGCHTVTTGIDFIGYSPDYPGPLRQVVRDVTGGECVFLQGAGGNVMPRFAFDDECLEPGRMGRRLAAGGAARRCRPACVARSDSSRRASDRERSFACSGGSQSKPIPRSSRRSSARVEFPLLPLPSLDEVVSQPGPAPSGR